MRRRGLLAGLAAMAVAVPSGARAEGARESGPDIMPPGSPVDGVETVAAFGDPGPSGVAVTLEGRIFVSFPRHAVDHDRATLGELRDGKLVPFPSEAMSRPSDRPAAEWLVSVHGITMDRLGRLWVVDDGKRAGKPIPEGGAKIVGFDPGTGKVVASIVLQPPALLPDSHMNDLRVDLSHGAAGTAYVADSSFGTKPALVVVDLATGAQRRVLAEHPSTQPERGFMAVLEGRPHVWTAKHPTFPTGGIDGIALSPDEGTLYYAPLSSRRLYSIPTGLVADSGASEDQLAAGVRDEGEKGFADGMCMDARGRLYTTNGEHDAILRRDPDGSLVTVVQDPRLIWPDGICADAIHVYVVAAQWNRLPSMNGGKNLRRPPYLLLRVPLDAVHIVGVRDAGDHGEHAQPALEGSGR